MMLNEWGDREPLPRRREWLLCAEATVIVVIQCAAIVSMVAAHV